MGDAIFFVRMRGQVTGPYELPALRAMVRRGALSRIHELSVDGTQWAAAGVYPELFAQGARSMTSLVTAAAPVLERRSPPAPPVREVRKYFYRQDGRTFGPVPLPILQRLAESGKLREDAQVWPPDDKTPIPARQLAELRFEPALEAAQDVDSRVRPQESWRGRLLLSLLAALPLLVAALIILFLHYHRLHLK